jgi:hypothetical protein
MKRKIKELAEKLNLDRKNITAAIFSLIVTSAFFLDQSVFHHELLSVLLVVDSILLGIILLFAIIMAGFTVMKALIEVAAGLSLLIFLAQSYCSSGYTNSAGNDSLKSVLAMGLLYMSFHFFQKLYESLTDNLKKIRGKEGGRVEKTIVIALYIIFTGLFLWEIYRIIDPIVRGLCVYR